MNVQPAHSAQRLSYVRGFARYRCASDPRTQIPSPGLLPFQPKRARPYLYSDEEINSLLCAALNMSHRYNSCALLPWVYYCLFGLLSVTGLRLGEAQNLKIQDVDLETAVLTIRSAKFGKTRLIPLDTIALLYLQGALGLYRQTPAPLGGTVGVALLVCLQLGKSVGQRTDPPRLLSVVPADRPAW